MITQEDYERIRQYLQATGVKDTELSFALTSLKGNEYITFVQDGHNVKACLKDFLAQLNLLGTEDVINVSAAYGKAELTLAEAISLIPAKGRKIGQVITYLDTDGKWVFWQFKGHLIDQWFETSLWEDIMASLLVSGTQVADEEDLTAVADGDHSVIKLRDREPDPDVYASNGIRILRKNPTTVIDNVLGIEVTKNHLSQGMVNNANVEYIVKYDYDLNGDTITMKAGCKLLFQGGTITNGTLVGNGTVLNMGLSRMDKLALEGTWNIDNVYAIDQDSNVEFPAMVTASSFNGEASQVSPDADAIVALQARIDALEEIASSFNGEATQVSPDADTIVALQARIDALEEIASSFNGEATQVSPDADTIVALQARIETLEEIVSSTQEQESLTND